MGGVWCDFLYIVQNHRNKTPCKIAKVFINFYCCIVYPVSRGIMAVLMRFLRLLLNNIVLDCKPECQT